MQPLAAQQRYATLKAMGVTLWVPRKRLVGAAPSHQCDWPEAAAPVSGKEKLLAEMQNHQQPPAQTPPSDPHPVQPAKPEPAPAPPPPAAVLETTPPLVADVWLLANGWQLVIERLQESPLTQPDLRLLQNLLAALYPGGLGIVSQHAFAWPLPGVPLERGDEEELNLSLRAFLTGAQFRSPPVGVLVFGERSGQLLSAHQALPLPDVYTAPSLEQLLQNPQAKQAFWQQAGTNGLRARFASSPVMM
ncbi:hypothetical protein [Marinospirillum sp.]|uniref:hypothetical protein n=1 Tax=Marinospirillum sp. TaxID=2183934 RepID=UPI00384A7CB0